MSQQIVVRQPIETKTVCTTCKYFKETEEHYFCKFYDAFIAEETLCIPCEFKDENEVAVIC